MHKFLKNKQINRLNIIIIIIIVGRMKEYLNNKREEEEDEGTRQGYKLSRYRHINLLVFLFAALVNSLPSQTFSSINSRVEEVFNISRVTVTLNTLLFPVLHPICAFPSSWILDHYGIRIGCTCGGILVVTGVWLRTLLVQGSPTLCLLGTTLAAIGNTFIIGSPSMFAISWFDSGSAAKVIALTVLCNLLSSGIGGALGGIFLSANATKEQILSFLKLQAFMVTIPYVVFMIFFREKPTHFPSHSAEARSKQIEKKQPYKLTIKKLLANTAYVKICVAMSLGFGTLISFFSIVNQCLTTLGYKNPGEATSVTLISAMAFGLFSAVLFTYGIRKTQKYRFIISLCLFGSAVNFLILQIGYFFKIQNSVQMFFLAGGAGFFLVPITSLFTSYASEAAFPEGQGSITGYLFAVSQTFGFVLGITCISWIDGVNHWKIHVILIGHSLCFIMSFLVNWFTPEQLNRTKFERRRQRKVNKDDSLIIPPLQEEQGQENIST